MQNYRECFEKVRKDCVKYIQSQETKKEKFKNSYQNEKFNPRWTFLFGAGS